MAFIVAAKDIGPIAEFNYFDVIRTRVLKAYNRGLNIPVTAIVFAGFNTTEMCIVFRIMWTKSTDSMLLSKQWADNTGVRSYSLYEILKHGGLI